MASAKTLKLLDNIQFIYELALARLELQVFNPELKVTNDFREFTIEDVSHFESLKKRLAYFKTVNGDYTDYCHLQKYNQTHSVNQFLTHWIYPYKGKFHPQMIRALLNIMKVQSGETILDPFVGSGTALLEAQLLGINSMGVDVSPLCALISKVKTESLSAIKEIKKYKNLYLTGKVDKEPSDERVRNFYKLAEMMAHSDQSRRGRDFHTSFLNDAEKMLASVEDYQKAKDSLALKLGKATVFEGDARNLLLEDDSMDGVITSPPYSIALNYVANDAHSLEAMGYDLQLVKANFIGVRGSGNEKFKLYDQDMEKAYNEMYRVLKRGKYCVIIIGNVTYQGQEVNTAQNVIDYCGRIGFKIIKKMEKIIYGLYNVMQKEYILIFQKL